MIIKKKQEDFTCYDLFAKVYYPLHYISNNTWINTKIYLTGSHGCKSFIPKVDILSCSRIKRLFLYLLIILNIYLGLNKVKMFIFTDEIPLLVDNSKADSFVASYFLLKYDFLVYAMFKFGLYEENNDSLHFNRY